MAADIEHIDRGYENFDAKRRLGVRIHRFRISQKENGLGQKEARCRGGTWLSVAESPWLKWGDASVAAGLESLQPHAEDVGVGRLMARN